MGESLIEKLRAGIDGVDFVVAILSEASVASKWVQKELDVAMNHEIKHRKIKVLPVLRDEIELPGFLEGKLFADFRTPNSSRKALPKLIQSINSL